jgi:putative Holliday junction resolvase
VRVLALDHGSARCGCAVCDPSETIVRPLTAVARPDSAPGQELLLALVRDHEVDEVVVGLPLLTSGEEGAQAAAAKAFAGRLRAKIDAPVTLFDERFTTRMAQSSIAQGASSDEDSLAAAHLLEAYLASRSPAGGDAASDDEQ